MPTDVELLQSFIEGRSEEAFASLVRQRIDLVFSVALRQCGGDAHLASDVVQRVFLDLARKAATLSRRPALSGWLCRSAQLEASNLVRIERRRRARESKAHTMQNLSEEPVRDTDWNALRPVLDEAMGSLSERDRDAVMLRFFEKWAFRDIGAALRMSEDGARMRVDRALDRLRARLARRGITSTSAALGLALANQACIGAPPGLAAAVAGASLTGGGVAAGAGAWTAFMSISKLQLGAAVAVAAAGASTMIWETRVASDLKVSIASLQQENLRLTALAAENARLASALADADKARAKLGELDSLRSEGASLRHDLNNGKRRAEPQQAAENVRSFAGPVFEQSQVDVKTKPNFQAKPVYPAELRKAGVEGKATIDLVVDADGRVRHAKVLEASESAFGEAALKAVQDWTYAPAQKNGGAVAVHLQVPLFFKVAREGQVNPNTQTAGLPKPATFVPWF